MNEIRRALFVALGVHLAEHLAAQEEEAPARELSAPRLFGRAFGMEIVRFNVTTSREMIDVTTFGSSVREVIPGLVSTRFEFECLLDADADPLALMDTREVEFDEAVRGTRLRARLVVDSVELCGGLGELMTARISARAIGQVEIEPVALSEEPRDSEADVRRGIRLT